MEDLATTKQPGIDLDRERIYKTFITVAVRTDQVPFGVLSANATSVGDLTELDLRMIEVLAHLLATAEALALGTTMTNRLQQRNSVRSPAQPDGEGVS
ncbi:hypothetical protein C5C71_16350 [Rathayibacter sp. AY1C1]|nr:hypothetical protein C5C71_16350 [Rathayibacter sp. AY1C1]